MTELSKMSEGISRPEVVTIIVKATLIGVISYFGLKWTIDALDPTRKQKKEAHDKVSLMMFAVTRVTSTSPP